METIICHNIIKLIHDTVVVPKTPTNIPQTYIMESFVAIING